MNRVERSQRQRRKSRTTIQTDLGTPRMSPETPLIRVGETVPPSIGRMPNATPSQIVQVASVMMNG